MTTRQRVRVESTSSATTHVVNSFAPVIKGLKPAYDASLREDSVESVGEDDAGEEKGKAKGESLAKSS